MKNIYKYAALFVAISFFASCEEDLVIFDNNSFIQIEDSAAATLTENSGGTIDIVAQLASPQATDITVNFDVTGDASRYALTPASLVIAAGDTEGSVSFSAIDDDEINGDIDVIVALATSSGLPVGIGGAGVSAASKTITIIDDNVPCNNYVVTVVADRWGSEVIWDILDADGAVVATGGPYDDGAADFTTTDEASVNLPDGCYTFRVFDWWGDSWSAGGASYKAQCGALVAVLGDGDGFTGIPGLDISTVPDNPAYGSKFRAASANATGDYVEHAEQVEFCVNQ